MELFKFADSFKQIDLKKELNALLVSDLHLSDDGQSYFSQQAIEKTIKNISILVNKINPNQIFVLGDLFHGGQQKTPFVSQIMKLFSKFEQEVFIIGGNHDQVLIEAQIDDWSQSNLHIFSDAFIICETNHEKIWFTHDGLNSYMIDKSKVPDFITSLKRIYEIDEHDWLITGHTHLPCLLKTAKVASIGCFNAGRHNQASSYGLATVVDNEISIELHNMEDFE